MRIAKIKYNDIANGPGIRVSLFTQGCPHHCKNCFNPETWDNNGGEDFSIYEIRNQILNKIDENEVKRNLSLLGGEPLRPEIRTDMNDLLRQIKQVKPNINIWCWTGYLWEEIKDIELMQYIDVLIDGPYIEAERDITLKWRGSKNQKIIDVQKSLKENKVIIYGEEKDEL